MDPCSNHLRLLTNQGFQHVILDVSDKCTQQVMELAKDESLLLDVTINIVRGDYEGLKGAIKFHSYLEIIFSGLNPVIDRITHITINKVTSQIGLLCMDILHTSILEFLGRRIIPLSLVNYNGKQLLSYLDDELLKNTHGITLWADIFSLEAIQFVVKRATSLKSLTIEYTQSLLPEYKNCLEKIKSPSGIQVDFRYILR